MFDLLVNGKVVAVCAEPVVGIFKEALVRHMPLESTIECKRHTEPQNGSPTPVAEGKPKA